MSTVKRKRVSLKNTRSSPNLNLVLSHQKSLKSMTFLEIQYQHGLKKKKKSKMLSNPVKLARKGKI